MFAFVGVLDVEQVLNLWDRVLGYERGAVEGLELFSIAAVALFWERRGVLMAARCARDVEVGGFRVVLVFGAMGMCVNWWELLITFFITFLFHTQLAFDNLSDIKIVPLLQSLIFPSVSEY